MPEIADGDKMRFVVVGRLFNQTTVNTFYFRWAAATPGTFLPQQVAHDSIAAVFSGPYQSVVTSDWTGIVSRVEDPRTAPVWSFYEQALAWTGSVAPSTCPPSTAVVITRNTGTPGRSYRGRVYIPAVADAWHIEGRLDPMQVGQYAALGDVMLGDIDPIAPAGSIQAVVWSHKLQSSLDMNGYVVRTVLRQQRRREVGVGI